MIDICDFAVGLSRQLDGRTMPSERPGHRLMETWHPLGVVGVISAFNFPVAVWSWNTALALVCGDTVVWKPSPMTAADRRRVHAPCSTAPPPSAAPPRTSTCSSSPTPRRGQALVDSPDVALVSATGSERMGAAGRAARGRPLRHGSCWSSAATTPRSSRRRPTSSSPRAASSSPRPAPPASAARPCAA